MTPHFLTLKRLRGLLPTLALTAAVPLTIFILAVAGGGSGTLAGGYLGLLTALALFVAVLLGCWRGLGRVTTLALAAFAALTVETGLSAAWSGDKSAAVAELSRSASYLALFALGLVLRRLKLRLYNSLLALALSGVGLLALASRLFPALKLRTDLSLLPSAADRLSYPVGYWNGLAVLCALSLPLTLALSLGARRRLTAGLFLALAVPPVLVVYLASSRGGFLALAVGGAVVVLAVHERVAALARLVIAALGALAAIALVSIFPTVASAAVSATSRRQGFEFALGLALVLLLTALLGALLPRRLEAPRWLRLTLTIGLLVGGTLAVALAQPLARLRHFADPPTAAGSGAVYVRSHLLSGSSSGRWQLWQAAVSQFHHHPLLGGGAGSYESFWQAHGSLILFVRDAHSLYLETLAELGIVGLGLLLLFLALALSATTARLRQSADRIERAALLAFVLAFFVAAGVDWLWELPALAVGVFFSLGLLIRPDNSSETGANGAGGSAVSSGQPRTRSIGRALVLAAAVIAVSALVSFQMLSLAASEQQSASEQALARGDVMTATRAALAERRLAPWSAQPDLQLALVAERAGWLASAESSLRAALARNDGDWRLWLTLARVEVKRGEIRLATASLARARALAPRLPLWTPLSGS